MRIKTLSFGKKITENYNSRHADVEIDIEEGDSFEDAVKEAKRAVAFALGLTPKKAEILAAREVLETAGEL